MSHVGKYPNYVYVGIDPSSHAIFYYAQVRGSSVRMAGVTSCVLAGNVYRTAVECPANVYRKGAAPYLLRTAFNAGRYAERNNGAVVAPEVWRKWLTGKRNPSDQEIKAALEKLVVLPKRTNPNTRDAIGIALWLQATDQPNNPNLPRPAPTSLSSRASRRSR